ncbi:MAG: SdpI family protein [Oscillospiraceae bacterium]|nr:SdpI family protein [Oscillospiraceae bacterium]
MWFWIILGFLLFVSALGLLFDVEFWIMLAIVLGICVVLIIIFVLIKKAAFQYGKRLAENYQNEEWRALNPEKARKYEELVENAERKRDQMMNGPSVSITKIRAGHLGGLYNESWNSYADSAGGWSIRFNLSNIGGRTINYVTISFAAINRVGDKCYCRIHDCYERSVTYTGPLESGRMVKDLYFENVWYDIPLDRVAIESIYVEFSGGKSQTIHADGSVSNYGF